MNPEKSWTCSEKYWAYSSLVKIVIETVPVLFSMEASLADKTA